MTAGDDARVSKPSAPRSRAPSRLAAAALALPGILPAIALAQTVPDQGLFELSYLNYRDWQPGGDRMSVQNPSFYILAPFAEKWTVEGSVVYDAMSGASPVWFNTLSGASGLGVNDYRTAGDVKVTRYFDRFSVGVGGAYSHEHDFISRAGSLDVRWWTEDRNTTFNFGFGGESDYIHPSNRDLDNGGRDVLNYLLGVTQNLSPNDIIQSNVSLATGHGYYSDPYKPLDTRPDTRNVFAWLTRYNHHFDAQDATLQFSYRYIHDSFGGDSNAVDVSWQQNLAQGWAITPTYRYYTQGAANFYYNPPWPTGYVAGNYYTADTRLAAFGAMTIGAKVGKMFGDGWSLNFNVNYCQQRSDWRLFGNGSPGIDTFSARWFGVDIAKTF